MVWRALNAPGQAIERLREGNRRFVAREPAQERAPVPAAEQYPFAAVLGCSDSRVPVEIVFDQGFGDLFVIRVAGNVAGSSQIGSVEFAVTRLRTPLVVVMGHTRCGAVEAAVDLAPASEHLRMIIDFIRPSVAPLLHTDVAADRDALLLEAVRANVRSAVRDLADRSRVLAQAIAAGALAVVGAVFRLETGEVEFLRPS